MTQPNKPQQELLDEKTPRSVSYHEGLIERLKDKSYFDAYITEIQRDAVKEAQAKADGVIAELEAALKYCKRHQEPVLDGMNAELAAINYINWSIRRINESLESLEQYRKERG